ncbi:hypothetical protein O3P69_003024 [Scylla paramamosain]|uniref:C-type lectin domain-containing protein n=2 Tax=Scylla paramamosain TaxID=85552 RepID=A0AAW0UN38_SCYPA
MKWTAPLAVAAAALCLASIQAYDECPEGFIDFADVNMSPVCMSFVHENTSWHETRNHCKSMNGDLGQLTGNLHQKVTHFIKHRPEFENKTFWIGGSDVTMEGRWVWVIDDTDIPRGTPHWFPCNGSEPDGGSFQNYLGLLPPGYYFHSLNGYGFRSGICQLF